MPQETDRLKLPLPLGNENVNRESINGIFEKIDAGVATQADLNTLREAVSQMDIPDASLTQKGKVQLSSAVDSSAENMAATPKAVKAAVSEALSAKQLGVEQKANVVAALNSIGVSASTSETWAQLISKMAGVIRATGNATAAQVLSGATFSNATGNGRTGTMPNRSAQSAHQLAKLTEVWLGDRTFFMPPDGYYDGQSWVYALTPDLSPSNIRNGKNILGVAGALVEGKQFASGFTYASNSPRIITVNGLSFRPKTVIVTSGLPYLGTFMRGIYSEDINYYTISNDWFVPVPLNMYTEVSANPNDNPTNIRPLDISITSDGFTINIGGYSSNQPKIDYLCFA
ncbi:tail fiber protein [Paenibacillus sp. NPDC056933]|uniref:tail fiber protein n=1 Tax=Paenibacillus sp. NPDC056933 TaxID=3345968 RepID=UPI00363247FB